MNIPYVCDTALRAAGLPVIGVSIGDPANRSTWTAQLAPTATAQQQAQAATLLSTITLDAAADIAQTRLDAQSQVDQFPSYIKAIILTLVEQINVLRAALPTPLAAITPAQAVAAIRTKAGQL